MNYYVHVVNKNPVAFYRDDKLLLGEKFKNGKKLWISDRVESQEVTVAVDYFMAKIRQKATDLPKGKWPDVRHAHKHGGKIPYLAKAYTLPAGEIKKILRAK